MATKSTIKSSKAARPARKATTFRLDPPVQQGLELLQAMLKRPLNRLVNEAVQAFVEKRTAEVESELQQMLVRVQAYRKLDPGFGRAIAAAVEAEARWGADDPVEGRTKSGVGPAQAMVQELLRG
jgi:predicted DNA-binding protein